MTCANKLLESITSHKLGCWNSRQIAKSATTAVCNGPELLSSVTDKAKLFAEILDENSDVDDSGISVLGCSFRFNLKLKNIPVTPLMVKKVIAYLYSARMYGPNCTSGGSGES